MKRILIVTSIIFGISSPTLILINEMNYQGYFLISIVLFLTLVLLIVKKIPLWLFNISTILLLLFQCLILLFYIRFTLYPNALVVIIPENYKGTINVYFGLKEYRELKTSNGYMSAITNNNGLLLTSTRVEDIPDRIIVGYVREEKLQILEESDIVGLNIAKVNVGENRAESFSSLYACVRQSILCSDGSLLKQYNDSIENIIKDNLVLGKVHIDNNVK